MSYFKAPYSISAVAPPQTYPLGELTELPQTQRLAGFKSGVRDKGRKKGKRQDEIDS